MACIYKINGKTFNTTEEIQNYVSSDEFVSVLAKGNLGISKEIRNLILNKDEKTTNEVREVEDGQREKGNEGKQSKGKNDGQKTNDVQNEEVTEGGVKAPQVKAGSVGVGGDVVDSKTKQQLLDERLNKIKEIKDKAEGTREERTKRYNELVNELGDETAALKKLQEEINAKAKKEIDKLPELPKTENEIINEKGENDFEKIKKDLGFKSNNYSWGKSPMDEDMGDMLLSKDKESVIFIKPNEVDVYDEKNDQTDTITNGVKIELVSTKEKSRGKGKAKEMVQKVTDWADKNNTDLHLDIAPQDKSTTESGLKKLYESFGFEFDGIHGIRKPKAVEQSLKETPQAETSKPKPENVKAIEEAITKKSGTIKNEIIKEAADPTEVKKILDNLDSIKSKLAGLTTKDGDSVFSEECKWG